MRKLLVGALVALLISLVSAAAPVYGGDKPPSAPSEERDAPPKADGDGDRIFDDLEDRLATMADTDELSVIVQMSAPASLERLEALRGAVSAFAVSHRFSLVEGFAATVSKRQVHALARLPQVVRIEENAVVHALNDSAQTSFGVAKARADGPAAGNAALDGSADGDSTSYSKGDLVAAVIDTGIDGGHQDVDGGKIIAFVNCTGGTCVAQTPFDDNGHGTHVAGTIAGDVLQGVAPAAALVGVKVLDSTGNGSMANVTKGIEWVVANRDTYGIEAINLSLGTTGCANGTDATSVAVNHAHAAGIVVAVAAGNSGPGTCTVGSPGAATGALTVGAMADMGVNGFRQAYFSSRGPTSDGRLKPDVSAPGLLVTSARAGTVNGYIDYSGTSMATPFTVGVALLMRDANAALTSQQVKDKLMQTAVDWGRGGNSRTAGTSGPDIEYGAGRLDAYAAIASAGAGIAAPPAMPAHELREGTLPGTGTQIDYILNVTDTQFPIAATLIHPSVVASYSSNPDFDLYLLDPNGVQVAKAETSRRQDELGYKPAVTGAWTLRVRSWSGAGSFFVDVSAGLGAPPADTTPPTVASVSPGDGATAVAPSANVTTTFSEPMDQAATQAAFSLVDVSNAPVAGTFSWSGTTMTFDPAGSLASAAQYTARVTTAAQDPAGNALAAEEAWSFTVSAGGPPAGTAYPSAATVIVGSLKSGTAGNLAADDDAYYEVNSNTATTRAAAWYGTFAGVPNTLTSLRLSFTGKHSRSCAQTVALKRWTTNAWVVVNSQTVGTTEVAIVDLPATGTLAEYVSGTSGDGDVQVRLRCTTTAGTFFSSADLLRIAYEQP
ncbi:MAG: S8 family serine peptidase [Gaiellaceae bacterium]